MLITYCILARALNALNHFWAPGGAEFCTPRAPSRDFESLNSIVHSLRMRVWQRHTTTRLNFDACQTSVDSCEFLHKYFPLRFWNIKIERGHNIKNGLIWLCLWVRVGRFVQTAAELGWSWKESMWSKKNIIHYLQLMKILFISVDHRWSSMIIDDHRYLRRNALIIDDHRSLDNMHVQ